MEELICREGVIHSVIFQNAENGYTVLRLLTEEGEAVTVVGCIPCAAPGERLTVTGVWERHPQHGEQLRASEVERSLPEDEEEMVSYLSSGVLKNDAMYGALPADELFHLKRPPLFAFHAGLDFGGEFPGGDQGGGFLPVRQIAGQGPGVGGQAAVRQDNFGSGYAPLNPPELPDIGLHGQGLPPQREDQEQARDGRAAPKMEQNPGGGPNNGG